MRHSKGQDGRKKLGNFGEKLALEAYETAGYTLVEHQYRCRFGEIDLILRKRDTLYFVEVRTKTSERFGTAEESISNSKRRTIRKVCDYYLLQKNVQHMNVRCDVVCIYIDKETKTARLYRYEDAF